MRDVLDMTGDACPPTAAGDPIAEFYTRHPYPPPVRNLDRARVESRDPTRHRAEYHVLWPRTPYCAALDILVAGCGTWQAAKYALCRPEARVVGIDVSPASIAHSRKLQRQYNLSNLDIQQWPIEQVGRLGRQFDLIVCTGVLHHLEDPDAGLRALRSALRPGGAMYLMVYAPYGRIGVSMLQEYCRTLGIGTSEREIRDLVAMLETLPQRHPLVPLLRGARDATNADALADALLNPRDRSYSVPELFDFLDQNGMTFGRWYWQAPYLPQCAALMTTPHAAPMRSLPPREQYRLMELWRGTMTAHSVVAYHDSESKPQPCLDDEHWTDFVPVPLPRTRLLQERLPAGAAGVLLNQSHPFPDLILVIDRQERRLFDLIDGQRSIAAIADLVPGTEGAPARAFFGKLWSYDQVVFDASGAR